MNWIDFTIIGVIVFSALVSVVRGFTKEALSLVIWFGAFFIAKYFYPLLAAYLTNFNDPLIKNGVAIAVLFISTLIVGAFVNNLIGHLISKTGLSGTDRVLGVIFGALRGVLIISALIFGFASFTQLSDTFAWKQSVLLPEFEHIISWFFSYLEQNSTIVS